MSIVLVASTRALYRRTVPYCSGADRQAETHGDCSFTCREWQYEYYPHLPEFKDLPQYVCFSRKF